MKCVHCGANIPDDQMICPVCGAEVQIVPDYNPLDDVLAREVRGSVEGATRQIRTDDIRRYRREDLTKNINSTRVLSEDEMERIRSNRRKSTNNTERNSAELRRQRQARQQKRLEAAKRKRRRLLLTLAAVVILIGFGIYVAYQNSYTGMLKKGYRAVNEKEYMAAEKYFDRAIIKDKSRPDAYVGLAEIYLDQNDTDGAEDVYLSAIETQPTNEKLYQAAIDFYMFALGFQGFLILICVAIYAVLLQNVAISGDAINSIWSIVGYTVLLCFSLFKTSSVAKTLLGAH